MKYIVKNYSDRILLACNIQYTLVIPPPFGPNYILAISVGGSILREFNIIYMIFVNLDF
jgi:hypothetical protein